MHSVDAGATRRRDASIAPCHESHKELISACAISDGKQRKSIDLMVVEPLVAFFYFSLLVVHVALEILPLRIQASANSTHQGFAKSQQNHMKTLPRCSHFARGDSLHA